MHFLTRSSQGLNQAQGFKSRVFGKYFGLVFFFSYYWQIAELCSALEAKSSFVGKLSEPLLCPQSDAGISPLCAITPVMHTFMDKNIYMRAPTYILYMLLRIILIGSGPSKRIFLLV